jgi:hypothetical protein
MERWICPHCEHAAVLESNSKSTGVVQCGIDSADGPWVTAVSYTVCANPTCRLTTIQLTYGSGRYEKDSMRGYYNWFGSSKPRHLTLRPSVNAKRMPEYVPAQIREDYREACVILEASPKAAATLARRALQGMIRDFYGVKGRTLAEEVTALKEKVDPLTWQAIDAVRKVGNIGAHMERDIDLIIDVDPGEALKLVRLIELLVSEWYENRFKREQAFAEIISMAAEKETQRKAPQDSTETVQPDA